MLNRAQERETQRESGNTRVIQCGITEGLCGKLITVQYKELFFFRNLSKANAIKRFLLKKKPILEELIFYF